MNVKVQTPILFYDLFMLFIRQYINFFRKGHAPPVVTILRKPVGRHTPLLKNFARVNRKLRLSLIKFPGIPPGGVIFQESQIIYNNST